MTEEAVVDDLTHVLLMEMGSNIILHSGKGAGDGWGVFAGSISPKGAGRVVSLCIADLGRGIPSALKSQYEEQGADYHSVFASSLQTGIIRFALEAHSSSRPRYATTQDHEAYRGLAVVADTIRDRGHLLIRSDGGAIELSGRPSGPTAEPLNDYDDHPLPGVQIACDLSYGARVPAAATRRIALPQPATIEHAIGLDGTCHALATPEEAERFVRAIAVSKRPILVDIGFGDLSIRSLELLVKAMVARADGQPLIIWNARSPWSSFAHLGEWLAAFHRPASVTVVRGPFDVRSFGGAPAASAASSLALSSEHYLGLAHAVNSSLLAHGQRAGKPEDGFFSGKIHLPSGRPVEQYFAFAQHISRGGEAHTRRWVASATTCVQQLLRPSFGERLILLGFAVPIRELLGRVALALGQQYPAYAILTYDVPTREEIESCIKEGDHVLLVTDVVSNGSLVRAVAECVTAVRGATVGVVALVDARPGAELERDTIAIGRDRVAFRACSRLSVAGGGQRSISQTEYWLDPVSLIPDSRRPWDPDVDRRVSETLRVLLEAEAFRSGHVVDGVRHTSVYVDLQRVAGAGVSGECDPLIDAAVAGRLEQAGWGKFDPTLLLYPAGIARIESAMQPSRTQGDHGLTVYQTAARSYAARLRRIWPQVVELEIPRAFDPGGLSFCARAVPTPGTEATGPHPDIVVADDGMWSGRTVQGLIRVALEKGGVRILVVPLLARMRPRDLAFWESLRSVDAQGRSADVTFAFPLVLPIPYYSRDECPYEATIARLKPIAEDLGPAAPIARTLIARLARVTPDRARSRPLAYVHRWVRVRCLVELASESDQALEELLGLVNERSSSDTPELRATIDMFLEEWRLLGRARLRQVISPAVELMTIHALQIPDAGAELVASALSCLRSRFVASFLDVIPHLSASRARDPVVLGRALLHISSLPAGVRRRSASVASFTSSARRANSELNDREDGDVATYLAALTALELERGESAEMTPREAAVALTEAFEAEGRLKHELRFSLKMWKRAPSQEWGTGIYREYSRQWNEDYRPFLLDRIWAPLKASQAAFRLSGMKHIGLPSFGLDYLTSREAVAAIPTDLASVELALTRLADGTKNAPVYGTMLATAASRLLDHLLLSSSTLATLLAQLGEMRVRDFILGMREEFAERFAGRKRVPMLQIDPSLDVVAERTLFGPSGLIRALRASILDNLVKHAFPDDDESPTYAPEVSVVGRLTHDELRQPALALAIRNDGRVLLEARPPSRANAALAADLRMLGGAYQAALPEREATWSVVHNVTFALW